MGSTGRQLQPPVRPRRPSGDLQQECPLQRAGREGFSVAQHTVKSLESDQKAQDEITALPGISYVTNSYLTSNLASSSVPVGMTAVPTPHDGLDTALLRAWCPTNAPSVLPALLVT